MSNSDHDEVGYGKPPKEHQFSKENQPLRRRRKIPKSTGLSLVASLFKAMDEDVTFTMNGKPTKAKAVEVLGRRIVRQGLGGPLNDQIKVVNLLRVLGQVDPEVIRAEIEKSVEDEHDRALGEEQARSAKVLSLAIDVLDQVRADREAFKVISDGFVGARSSCSCGSFEDYSEAGLAIQGFVEDDDLEPAGGAAEDVGISGQGWAPSVFGRPPSQAAGNEVAEGEEPPQGGATKADERDGSQPDAPGGDLADGMIGNDN